MDEKLYTYLRRNNCPHIRPDQCVLAREVDDADTYDGTRGRS